MPPTPGGFRAPDRLPPPGRDSLLTSAAVSKAAKRQRQKERKVERQRIEASLARRRKALKIGAYIGAVAIIVAGSTHTLSRLQPGVLPR